MPWRTASRPTPAARRIRSSTSTRWRASAWSAAILARAVRDGGDREARAGLALASLYGGFCLGPVNTTAGHAVAYPLGTRHHIAHGLACALIFPHTLAFNAPAVPRADRGDARRRWACGRSRRRAGIRAARLPLLRRARHRDAAVAPRRAGGRSRRAWPTRPTPSGVCSTTTRATSAATRSWRCTAPRTDQTRAEASHDRQCLSDRRLLRRPAPQSTRI